MKTNHHNHQPTLQNKSILIMLAAVILLACSQSALAQATPNKIPKWTDNSGVLGPSTIFEDTSGNIGIGTTNPTVNLELSGTANPIVRINGAALGAAFLFNSQTGTGQDRATLSVNAFYNGSWHFVNTSTPSWLLQMRNNEDDFVINRAVPNSYAFNALLTVAGTGNVGIGTTPSSYKLDVNGNTNVTGNINVFGPPNSGLGNITVSGNINAKFQDVAEWVQSAEKLPTGTVVALDSTKSNQVVASTVSYDTRVAGVISEQPGIALGEKGESKVLVATTGRVRVKVDATRAPIHIGDLLVTSDVPGVAMKSDPVNLGGVQIHRPGTLIGKALEPLEKGSGMILVLLSLQ